jgi:S-adenosyl methyltransferase
MAVPWPGRSPSTPAQVTAFFGGLDLVEPGVVSTPQWRPGAGVSPRPLPGWVGVARKL